MKKEKISEIVSLTVSYFGIDFRRNTRKEPYVTARMMFYVYMVQVMNMTLEATGDICGGRDHSTVINAMNRAGDLSDTDAEFRTSLNSYIDFMSKRVSMSNIPVVIVGDLAEVIHIESKNLEKTAEQYIRDLVAQDRELKQLYMPC